MRKSIAFISLLLIVNLCLANRVKTTDYYHVTGSNIDTLQGGGELTPDSVFIATYKGSATAVFTGWFNTGDAECAAAELNGIIFFDTYGDIDGAGGDGSYYTTAEFYDADRDIYHITGHWWEVGNYGDTIQQDLSNYDGATPLTASDNIGTNHADITNQTSAVTFTNTTIAKVTLVDSSAGDISYAANNQSAYQSDGDTNQVNPAEAGDPMTLEDRSISMSTFDTAAVAALYDKAIHLNDTTSNTNSIVGIDGTISNPVSSLAAAKILADSMGIKRYCIETNSSFTLDATYEDWEFIGVGVGNEINFGGQDIDNSVFTYLMIAGIQGGTGLIWLDECYLDAADSLECVARNSWLSDTVSVRVASNIIFDQCYSAVPGNATPAIDFNDAGTIGVNVRHYSGGLALLNMNSNHTISFESDGQLVIDGSCTSANVTARGNMTITDNGTTTSLTKDAVFSRSETVTPIKTATDKLDFNSNDELVPADTTIDGSDYGGGAALPDSSLGDISYIANNQDDYKADVSGCTGGGTGIYACSLLVLSSVDSSAVPNCPVAAKTDGGETVQGVGTTNGSGLFVFSLNAAAIDYYAGALANWVFSGHYDKTISGNQTDTAFATPVTSSPATGDMVALQFYQLTPGYDSLSATEVRYRLVKINPADTTEYIEYGEDDLLTFGTGNSTVTLSKSWTTELAQADSSYITFDIFSSWHIYVNGVQDTSSYVEFLIAWLDGDETRIVTQIDSTSTQNPAAP